MDEPVAYDLDQAAAWVMFVCDERRQEARLAKVAQMMGEAMFGGGGHAPDGDRFVEEVRAN